VLNAGRMRWSSLSPTYLVVESILSAGPQSSLFSHVRLERTDLSMFGRDQRKGFGRVVAPFGAVRTSRVEAVGGGSVDLALVDSSRAVRVDETLFGLVAKGKGRSGTPFELESTATVVASLATRACDSVWSVPSVVDRFSMRQSD